MAFEMFPVTSDNLAEIGYDESQQVLRIIFTNGSTIYEYIDVPREKFEGLLHADSHGKYFHANIKKVYGFRKVE